MIVKSYEIQKKRIDIFKYNLFLLYGENIGLKKDIKKKIQLEIKQKNTNIEISSLYESDILEDTNNNGVIESLEFCQQTWSENGRLQILDCGPIIINGNYNWLEISGEIPENITNWNQIEVLKMPYNNLYGLIPDNICQLNLNFYQPNIFNFETSSSFLGAPSGFVLSNLI